MALTRRQKEVLDFIAGFVRENGYSPSYEEIGAGLELASLATVHKHIAALGAKDYLRRGFNRSRSVDVSPKYFDEMKAIEAGASGGPPLPLEVPMMGRIAAGQLTEAVENHGTLNFTDFAGAPGMYALEVRGDSMIDDHICDGDYVLVQSTDSPRDGEIVVALVDGTDATLKRLYREPGGVARLQPANREMEPIRVPLENLQVQGRVVAVIRKY